MPASPLHLRRSTLLALLAAASPARVALAADVPRPPAELSAEAIEFVGREAEQNRQLAVLKRDLQRAQRDLEKNKDPSIDWKLQHKVLVVEHRIEQIEKLRRQQIPPGQQRELPIALLKAYVGRVKRRIEARGDEVAPEQDGKTLQGAADVRFTVLADGSVANLQVLSSAPAGLGPHAVALLQQLQPFERFPAGIAGKVDRISFVRSFRFEPGEGGEPRYRLRAGPRPRS